MARVTVEDCIDKVSNRFELVLLACLRARSISDKSPITVERNSDKDPVIALREIAEETISSADVKEDLIHSMQKYAEVDEPEPEAFPLLEVKTGQVFLGQDDKTQDNVIDRLTENELLRGLESIPMSENNWHGSRGPRNRR